VSVKKGEKFCSTRKEGVCDNGKVVPQSNQSPHPCFNYENTTYCMPVFTRAYANFACAISRATTNRSARSFTRRESGRSSRGQSRRSSRGQSGRSSPGESCRTGTAAADGKRTSRGTCRATAGCGNVTSRDGDGNAKPSRR
jgi:hypothetical protein